MAKLKCPNVVAAAIRLEEHKKAAEGKDLWLLGDALIKDCGKDDIAENTQRYHNGRNATLDRAREELEAHGIDYTVTTLATIRQLAMTFPKSERVDSVSFWGHQNAGNPVILKWILSTPSLKKYKNRKGVEMVDTFTIRELAKKYRELQDKRRQQFLEAARKRERDATTLDDKRKAREEVEQLTGMPKSGSGSIEPEPSALRTAANSMEVMGDLTSAQARLEEVHATLQAAMPKLRAIENLNEDFAAGFVEDCENIIAAATRIKDFLTGKSNVRLIKGGNVA